MTIITNKGKYNFVLNIYLIYFIALFMLHLAASHALDSYCLSVGSSDQALFGSTSLIPVAALIILLILIFVKASFLKFL